MCKTFLKDEILMMVHKGMPVLAQSIFFHLSVLGPSVSSEFQIQGLFALYQDTKCSNSGRADMEELGTFTVLLRILNRITVHSKFGEFLI